MQKTVLRIYFIRKSASKQVGRVVEARKQIRETEPGGCVSVCVAALSPVVIINQKLSQPSVDRSATSRASSRTPLRQKRESCSIPCADNRFVLHAKLVCNHGKSGIMNLQELQFMRGKKFHRKQNNARSNNRALYIMPSPRGRKHLLLKQTKKKNDNYSHRNSQ